MEIIIRDDVIRLNVICHKKISHHQKEEKEEKDMKAYFKKCRENNKEKMKIIENN